MSKEHRSVFLVALTYLAFASIGFIQNGSFLLPFPLNELVFFLLFLRFAFWHRTETISLLTAGIAAGASLLSSTFFWEIILSTTDQSKLFQSTFTDWTAFVSAIALLAWSIHTGMQQKYTATKVLAWIGSLFLLSHLIHPWEYAPVLSSIFLCIPSFIDRAHRPFHTLWCLLVVLELAKWISLLANS